MGFRRVDLLCSGKIKKRFSRGSRVALACALLPALTCFLSGCRLTERSQADRALIEQLIKRADDGWRKRDAVAATADYSEDAELILPNGRILQSREVIQAAQKQMLAGQAENKTDDQSRFRRFDPLHRARRRRRHAQICRRSQSFRAFPASSTKTR